MAKIKIEDFDGQPNPMQWVDDRQREVAAKTHGLVPYKVCLVEVCSFTFVFHSVMQVELCLDYYARKIRPSTRLPVHTGLYGGDHTETQRWFEKLPMYLLEEAKRVKVVAALERAVVQYGAHPSANTGTPKPDFWAHE